MLVNGMRIHELVNEVTEDLRRLNVWFNHHYPVALRLARKQKLPWWWCEDWRSPRNNLWRVMWMLEQRECHLNGPIVEYTIMENQYGKYLIRPQITMGGFILIIYLPHFYKRYRERMKLGTKLKTEQLMRRYLRNNTSGYNTSETLDVEVTTKEGIGLGQYLFPNVMLLKTFITYDMSYGDQVERFDEGREEGQNLGSVYKGTAEVMAEMKALGIETQQFTEKIKEKVAEKAKELIEQQNQEKNNGDSR